MCRKAGAGLPYGFVLSVDVSQRWLQWRPPLVAPVAARTNVAAASVCALQCAAPSWALLCFPTVALHGLPSFLAGGRLVLVSDCQGTRPDEAGENKESEARLLPKRVTRGVKCMRGG